ncbi:tumor necrosis factor receptor superfamily member 8 [Pogoniulus pusillus]|uniref:tumor necrosis factor receptor superfamily member 8 n=1 Tax=Pogoniulus pusillus TaxID=488313 RepID=UPI0030B98032
MAASSLALGLWLLLLLQDIQTLPQTSLTPSRSCDTLQNWFYDETSRSCCYRCPSGSVKKRACPRDSAEDCMRCGPEQYVDETSAKPQCHACVSCAEPELVEKKPCSFNASRVCECRPGLFCQTSVEYSCSRCQKHTVCKPGFGVKVRGTSMNDVTCEKCPSGTFSDQNSSTDTCKPHTNCAELNKVALSEGNATHDRVCMDLTPSTLPMRFSNDTSNSDLQRFKESLVTTVSILLSATGTENPSSTPEEKALASTFPTSAKGETTTAGPVLWAVVLPVVVLLVAMLLLRKWKVCKKLIRKAKSSDLVTKHTEITTADRGPEGEALIDRTLPLETNNNLVSSTEKACSPDLSLVDVTQSSGSAPDCPTNSPVRDHTNNRIENLYILKANTVIVGSTSGKNCAAGGCESSVDGREKMEEVLEMHYPEQETECFPGNDVMVPVEEEGKEFHHPTTATEK